MIRGTPTTKSVENFPGDTYSWMAYVPYGASLEQDYDRDYGDRPWNAVCEEVLDKKFEETIWPKQPGGSNRRSLKEPNEEKEVNPGSVLPDDDQRISNPPSHLKFHKEKQVFDGENQLKERYAALAPEANKILANEETCRENLKLLLDSGGKADRQLLDAMAKCAQAGIVLPSKTGKIL